MTAKYPNEPLKEPLRLYENTTAELLKEQFGEQQASAEVPGWAQERVREIMGAPCHGGGITFMAFARYIAAHEPAPVDPLREVAEKLARESQDLCLGFDARVDWFEAHLRARLPGLDALARNAATGEG